MGHTAASILFDGAYAKWPIDWEKLARQLPKVDRKLRRLVYGRRDGQRHAIGGRVMLFDRHPFTAPTQLRREMEDLFSSVFRGWPLEGRLGGRGYPALNVWEDAECLYAEAEVPGLSLNDIEVYVVGDELTIKGRRKAAEGHDLSFHRQERGTGEFSRTVALPFPVIAERVDAALKDGVLTLTLPKAESARPKKIVVKTN
jgi:HSP20 family protein